MLIYDCSLFRFQISITRYGEAKEDLDKDKHYQNTYTGSGYLQSKYSVRWMNADKFAKFFGVKSKYSCATLGKYKAFTNFASAIKKGSFVTYDRQGDGSWTHMGFVTYLHHQGKSARRNISYHGTTYKDFKVAQHTRNYHSWASDSNNNWEKVPDEDPKTIFGIVN